MSRYRTALPQLGDKVFITDGGLETTLVFHHGIELPEFAAYDLLRTADGMARLRDYYRSYVELALAYGVGIILETPTWRANADWGRKIGDDARSLRELNRQAVRLVLELREECETDATPIVVSGQLGPRGDGYQPDSRMNAREAESYHAAQIQTFAEAGADMVGALTLNCVDEAVGVARAAKACRLPVCVSFTVETDGLLPTGESLQQAIEAVDAATENSPTYYQVNCAHPTHFEHRLQGNGGWLRRIRGIRGNASRMSHAELDASETLDDGDPLEFGRQCGELRRRLPQLSVLGGCCGTDLRHIEQICISTGNT